MQSKNKDLVIFGATCPLVSKVHMEVSRAILNRMEIILIGYYAGHPEVEGTLGQYEQYDSDIYYSNKKIFLVGSKSDADQFK